MDKDFPVSELRIVNVYFHGNHMPSVRYMHKSQVDTFVKATVELHHERGNPYTGGKAAPLRRIEVQGLGIETVSYWWCTPGLHKNAQGGARINDPVINAPLRVEAWVHPEIEAERRA